MPPRPVKNRFIIRKPYITAEDDEIIKTTAQFTAKNGPGFVKDLAQREVRNPTFAFLKEEHPNYTYFASLCEAYGQCLHPKPQFIEFLRRTYANPQTLLKYSIMRAEYENAEEKKRKTIEDQTRAEEELFQSIDWHDFVIVETITFDEGEALPTPSETAIKPIEEVPEVQTTPVEVIQPIITKTEELPVPLPPVIDDVPTIEVKRDKTAEATQECPICHKFIPVKDMDKHLKIELASRTKKKNHSKV
ncbi:spliceosome associated protein [Entamoeba marina]